MRGLRIVLALIKSCFLAFAIVTVTVAMAVCYGLASLCNLIGDKLQSACAYLIELDNPIYGGERDK